MSDDELLASHVALRGDALRRHAQFVGGERAQTKIAETLGPLHERGEVHHLERHGEVEAVLAWRHDEDSWFGPPVSTVALDYRPGAEVAGWLAEVLGGALPRMEADLDLLLDASYTDAYAELRRRGLGVDAVILLGHVETASARLRAGALPVDALPPDVSVERMTEDDVDEVLSLFSETFRTEPQYCWFGASPRYVAKKRERLGALLAAEHDELVLRTAAGIRGHVSATVEPDDVFFGPTAGMSLCLGPELRGRGLLRPIYRLLLDRMRARGAVTFKGGTSQRGVMKLGVEMRRTLQAVTLRRGAYFDEAHFAPWVPLR